MRSLKRDKSNLAKDIKYKFYIFDVETTCLEPMSKNFVFGCMYGFAMRKVFYRVEDFIKEFSLPKYKGKYIFAHNAEFDLLTIFGNIFAKIDTAAVFNGKFISAKYKDTVFADSMNIYPTSVEKLGKLVGLEKEDNEKIRSSKLTKKNINSYDVSYCMRDCEIVYKALLKIFEMTGAVKITLPSLSMFDFRHNYLEHDLFFSKLVDEFYESYYGGRTEAFYIGKCNAKVYDMNSMYPAAMTTVTLPDIKHLRKSDKITPAYLLFCLNHYEGMAKVTVEHKETFFGYLPYRAELNKTVKLLFPVGEFTTTVNFNELRFAVNQGVVTIKKVFYVVWGNPIKSIFTQYINDTFQKRLEATDDLEKIIYKLKMNSLYGRFGMRLKMTTTYYEMIPFKLITELKESEKFCDIKLFNATRADCFLITENEKFKNSFFSIPTIASYITSEARVMLLKNLLANENNGVVYCDTDSIFLLNNFTGNIGCEIGQFKLEEKKVIEIKGLKNYIYIDEDGKENIVIKGISKSSRKTRTSQAGEETYEVQKYYKTKASLRQKKEAGESYIMKKVVRNNYDKREILEGGDTKPLFCKDGFLINALKFLRTATKKEVKRFKYEPENVREAVMMFFINGGKIWTGDMIGHITGKNKNELSYYKGLHSVDGMHMDIFCEHIPEHFYTDRIIDVFQDVLREYNSAAKMQEFLQVRADEIEREIIEAKAKFKEYEFEYDTPF